MNERMNKNSELNLEFDYTTMFRRAKVLMWLYLFTVLILKLIGFDVIEPVNIDLPIIDFINNNPIMRIAVKSLTSILVANLIYAYLIDDYLKRKVLVFNKHFRIFIISNFIIFLYSLSLNLLLELNKASLLTVTLSSTIYFIPKLFGVKFKDGLYILVIDLLFQAISVFTKNYNIIAENGYFDSEKNIVFTIIIGVDYYILWAIYLLNKKEKINKLEKRGVNKCHYWVLDFYYLKASMKELSLTLTTTFSVLKQRIQMSKEITSKEELTLSKKTFWNLKQNIQNSSITLWLKYRMWRTIKIKILPFVIFVVVYFGYAYMSDKILESIFLLVSYGTFRVLIPVHRQFHADYIPNIKKQHTAACCVLLSCLVLCSFLYNTTTSDISILSSIAIAFVLDWLLYVVTVYFQEHCNKKNK